MERKEEIIEVDEIDLRFCLLHIFFKVYHVDMQK
jgi:hypothetical protein